MHQITQRPFANIDAALDYAIECGVQPRYDTAGVIQAIELQAAGTTPLDPADGFQVEIGSEGYRAWYIHVDRIIVTETTEDDNLYVDVEVPSGVTATLTQGGRGGISVVFPPAPEAA